MEQERRLHNLATDQATTRETLRNIGERFDKLDNKYDKLEQGQRDIQSAISQISASNQKIEATLKFNIDAQIDAKLVPFHAALTSLREESIVRNSQLAVWSMIGGGAGTIGIALIGYFLKLWGPV